MDPGQGRGTNVYVLEFWATWSEPCQKAIPQLSDLQARFRDRGLMVIGVSRESAADVGLFVEQQGNRMGYTVAVDDQGQTSAAYLAAFGVDGLPHAFVVGAQGQVVWHGHPADGLEAVVGDVVAGTFDAARARRVWEFERLSRSYFDLLLGGQPAPGREVGDRLVREAGSHPRILNNFAWILLTSPRLRERDLDLATRAAKAAYDATGGREAGIVDTYARAMRDTGRPKEAVELQRQAVAAARDPAERADLELTLAEYLAQTR